MAGPIVFVGDSITELWGFHRAGTFEAYDLIPRGGSGQTARWITMRFARDLAETEAWGVHLLAVSTISAATRASSSRSRRSAGRSPACSTRPAPWA